MTHTPIQPVTGPLTTHHTSGSPRIAYYARGAGPETVIFLHGIGGNKNNWIDQLHYFSAHGFRAVAWDVRGYGESDDFNGPFRFEDISADLAALMDHLQVEQAHFVGLSMGGRILMDFAWRFAARVRSLTICGSFPSFGKTLSPTQRAEYLQLRQAPLLAGKKPIDLAPQLIASLLGDNAPPSAYDEMTDSIARLRTGPYLKALEAAVDFDRTEAIKKIGAPTLLLYADNDTLTPPDLGRQVHAMMPHAQLHILQNSGHLMNLEAADAFNAVVLHFLQELPQ